MTTRFIKLNDDWNAEPNAPAPLVVRSGADLALEFRLNPWQFARFSPEDRGRLIFRNCWRYRLGPTDDVGWHRGRCRFSGLAPAWGEFYEIQGDLRLEASPEDWIIVTQQAENSVRHFLFYFRDETFECDAEEVEILVPVTRSAGPG